MSVLARLAALLLPALLCAAPARAATISNFTFTGICLDCTGTGVAHLLLSDYTLGDPITDANFVSFAYDGTNLLPAYSIAAGQQDALSGAIAPPLPGTENFFILGNGENFTSVVDGFWCTGGACLLDYGSIHTWSDANATPAAVPEPMGLALLGTGLLGTAILRRRRTPYQAAENVAGESAGGDSRASKRSGH